MSWWNYYEPIMVERRYAVRNAWMGEERIEIPLNRPWRTRVDDESARDPVVRRKLHRLGYFRVRSDPRFLADEWARFPVWLPVRLAALWEARSWRFAGWLYRRGLIHSTVPRGVKPRWRDLRFGGEV